MVLGFIFKITVFCLDYILVFPECMDVMDDLGLMMSWLIKLKMSTNCAGMYIMLLILGGLCTATFIANI
jgi:hypothetical protein